MNYLGLGVVGRAGARFVSSCKDLYNDLNGANLTGAVDVVIVKQMDGSYKSTPFHVRFGKWGVLRTGDLQKEVDIQVNGHSVDNRMMIDESGSAYFIKPKPPSIDKPSPVNTESGSNTPHSDSINPHSDSTSTSETSILDSVTSTSTFPSIGTSILETRPQISREDDEGLIFINEDGVRLRGDSLMLSDVVREEEEEDNEEVFLPISQRLSRLQTLPLNIDDRNNSTHFYTPTDDPDEFNWVVDEVGVSCSPPSDIDSGALSDSAIEISKTRAHSIVTALSDSEIDERRVSSTSNGSSGIKSDGESSTQYNITDKTRHHDEASRSGLWGAFRGIWSRRKKRRFSSIEEGVYLDDIDQGLLDDDEKSMFFSQLHSQPRVNSDDRSSCVSSGVGSSPRYSPNHHSVSSNNGDDTDKIIDLLSDISISKCGHNDITEKSFLDNQIPFSMFCSNPEILSHPDVVIKMNGKYYNWLVAAPLIMSALLYYQTLPEEVHSNLVKKHMFKKSRQSFWNLWGRDTSIEKYGTEHEITESRNTTHNEFEETPQLTTPIINSLPDTFMEPEIPSSDEEGIERPPNTSKVRQRSLRRKRFIFTNELTTEELKQWPLKLGKNDLVFSITTKYQGTARATCSLYLWKYDDKIVVSDFDGTITRSDVAGQVLPLLGKDWTHNGVIELFSAINNNGYHLLYLSARAIGQSTYTKNYLRKTRRGDSYLPDGPLLVTPVSLYTAFKKEVIERKPEEFKILCLQQIRDFFPKDRNPYHAGFGNKPSDAKSYLEVNIPSSRIFIVNPKGEVKNELSLTFQSSYNGLMDFVDAQFPPIVSSIIKGVESITGEKDYEEETRVCMPSEDFSSFLYWQHSLNSFDKFELPDI